MFFGSSYGYLKLDRSEYESLFCWDADTDGEDVGVVGIYHFFSLSVLHIRSQVSFSVEMFVEFLIVSFSVNYD